MPPEIEAIIAGSRDAVRRVIADLRDRAETAERLRTAEHRAFMAEQREALADLQRRAEARIAEVRDGVDGKDGLNGVDGKNGERGLDGKDGRDGVDGKDGADGKDGSDIERIGVEQDGRDVTFSFEVGDTEFRATIELPEGPAGKDGERGDAGEPGADGVDGKDGEPGAQGEPGADGRDGQDAYPGEARGLFNEEDSYRALDVVSFNGSEWRAKVDNPGPLPGDGWMLSASRGKRGDRGERGDVGKAGADGKDGASVVAAYVDINAMKMVLTRDDGNEVEADLYDFASKIREA